MIRTATPEDLPALGPVYAAARRFMAENGNPTQWSDRYPLTEDLEEDIGKGQLYVWAPDGAVHGALSSSWGRRQTTGRSRGHGTLTPPTASSTGWPATGRCPACLPPAWISAGPV